MKIVAIDLETTIRCPVGTHKANPMWRGNKIIASGYKYVGDEPSVHMDYDVDGINAATLRSVCNNADIIVGHNIKFDLLYLYRDTNDILPRIWDTQLAAYILSGQRHLYASLDELTLEYVGKHALKDDKIKEYWKKGIDTIHIPKDDLLNYLSGDVFNTNIIFEKQFKEAEDLDILPLMWTQMDALRATISMNKHGMRVNWEYVNDMRHYYADLINKAVDKLKVLAPSLDYASPKQISLYFFGGEEKVKERVDDGFYKNGKAKTKLIEKTIVHSPIYAPFADVGKSGYYGVDDAVLNKLSVTGDKVADLLLVLRNATKIKETYYEGLLGLQFPDGNIYPNLNHCSTKTGRLSATNPNLQNQTDEGGVKKAYISRYGLDGHILELDYSQLEMIALAYVANDKQLIDDINAGRDMHRELYKEMYGRYPTDKERKPFKRFSFLLVYGGGATTLMAQSGCDRATAKKFIDTFYKRYGGVKLYHEKIVAEAEKNAVVSYSEEVANPQYKYYHKSATGRHYIFNKYVNEYKGGLSFSPTELKNWPIQGFATADVVPMSVGLLQRALEEAGISDKALLVMTVHDSVVLDVPSELLYDTAVIAKNVLESAPSNLKRLFNIDFPCKLSVGIEAGINWQDKKELSL